MIVGSLLPIVSCTTYTIEILQGKVQPQRMTRFLLLVVTALTLSSLLGSHDRSGMWLALMSFIQSALLFALSLKKGMGGRDRLDFICFALCIAGLAGWYASGQSLVGLVLSIVADLVASLPSLVKTWRLPHTESLLFYGIDTVAGLLVLMAGPYGWRSVLFPAYIVLANLVYVVAILRPVRKPDAQDNLAPSA